MSTLEAPTPTPLPVPGRGAWPRVAAGGCLPRPPAALDEHLDDVWSRQLRLGVVLSELGAGLVAAYAVLADRPRAAALLGIAAVVALGSLGMLAKPVLTAACGSRNVFLFYPWTFSLACVIVGLAWVDGGASSPLVLLLFLTLGYSALGYPPSGVALMGTVMVLAYSFLEAVAPADPAVAAVTVAILVGFTLLTWATCRNQWRSFDRQEQNARRLTTIATTDTLTGLAGRGLLRQRLESALEQGRHSQPAGLMLLDLDGFKIVNDSLGHEAGDVLLQQVASRIAASVRTTDTVGRLGGDEFAVVLPATGDCRSLERAARSVTEALARPFSLQGTSARVGSSIGLVLQGHDGDAPEELLRKADAAMYAAKRLGGGVLHYDPLRDDAVARRLLLAELQDAVERGQLRLHYQPSVQLEDGRVTGVEALVRWQHPARGLLGPGEFVPLAEESDLIAPLTAWVLDEAVRQCREWLDEGRDLCVAVNLSARSVVEDSLPDLVARVLARHGLPSDRLALEITETSLIGRPEDARRILGAVSALGVNLSVDDFGTGYATLSWLQRLPFNALKIDRSFVADVTGGGVGLELVRYTTQLAHAMGKVVVAEGVEGREQWDALRELGCDHAQGFGIGRPLPADDLLRWLDDWQGRSGRPLRQAVPVAAAA
ncbi:MAG: EAL domain-containing protein [Actinomycetota bacterium]|nr:EAL domain-containing protein [Actinomycetota bacterium]